jgi:26S proteasome regulatory subunit N7
VGGFASNVVCDAVCDIRYRDFFVALCGIERVLLGDRYLNQHTRYFFREMRVKAYGQYLESYRSVTIEAMAHTCVKSSRRHESAVPLTLLSYRFGVSAPFLDSELSRFIAARRLSAKIDKMGGVIETSLTDDRSRTYVCE